MIQDEAAKVIDWLTDWLGWLGAAAEELVREGLDWLEDLGEPGLAVGAAGIALGLLLLLWYASRR